MDKKLRGASLGLLSISGIDLEKGLGYIARADLDGRTFASRFPGRDNAGVRQLIRSVVTSERCGLGNAGAVRALASTMKLSSVGLSTLELVAGDYEALESAKTGKRTCDCVRCFTDGVRRILEGGHS